MVPKEEPTLIFTVTISLQFISSDIVYYSTTKVFYPKLEMSRKQIALHFALVCISAFSSSDDYHVI